MHNWDSIKTNLPPINDIALQSKQNEASNVIETALLVKLFNYATPVFNIKNGFTFSYTLLETFQNQHLIYTLSHTFTTNIKQTSKGFS